MPENPRAQMRLYLNVFSAVLKAVKVCALSSLDFCPKSVSLNAHLACASQLLLFESTVNPFQTIVGV